MGVLRLSLALMVLYVHLQLSDDAYVGVGPVIAVKAFYVVSGFYMAMILSGPYRHRPVWSFYANRALRLFPTHLVVLLVGVIMTLFLAPTPLALSGLVRLDRWPVLLDDPARYPLAVLVALLNVAIVGIHALHFACFEPSTGAIGLVDGRGGCPDGGFNMLDFTPNPPLWTLSIELLFYLAAPWLVRRRTRTLIAVIAASLTARALLYGIGYDQIPWNRTLFVLEIVYFLLGILAYRVHARSRDRAVPPWVLAVACLGFLLLSYGFRALAEPLGYRPGSPGLLGWGYILALAALLPAFFRWSGGSRVDRLIGELAYPAYICHLLVIALLGVYGGEPLRARLGGDVAWFAANVLATLAFSVVCLRLVAQPVEGLRARIRRG